MVTHFPCPVDPTLQPLIELGHTWDAGIDVPSGPHPGADLENEKGGFFCIRTLRAGENFAQPRPFLSQS